MLGTTVSMIRIQLFSLKHLYVVIQLSLFEIVQISVLSLSSNGVSYSMMDLFWRVSMNRELLAIDLPKLKKVGIGSVLPKIQMYQNSCNFYYATKLVIQGMLIEKDEIQIYQVFKE